MSLIIGSSIILHNCNKEIIYFKYYNKKKKEKPLKEGIHHIIYLYVYL